MTTALLNADRSACIRPGALVLIASAAVIGLVFIAIAALPYFSPSGENLARYAPNGWVLLVHNLALNTKGGWAFGSGLAGLATAWLITTGMAYSAIAGGGVGHALRATCCLSLVLLVYR